MRAPSRRSLSRAGVALLTLAVFLSISAFLSSRLLADPSARLYGGQDPMIFLWWLRWVPYALSHGLSPLHTDWLNHPYGVNAMWNTSMLLLGLVCAPLTLTIGPLATFNLLLSFAPALSGWVCFLVAGRLFRRTAPAVVAGLLYGFSPYMVAQSAGHLQLTWALFPPVLLLLCVELLRDQRPKAWLLGVAFGVLVGLQLLTGEELLATSALVAGASTLVLAAVFPREVLPRLRYVATALGVGGVTTLLIAGAGLYEQFLGPDVIHGPVQHVLPGADLLAPVVPTHFQLLHFASNMLIHRVDGANLAEQTSYLGAPLLALALYTVYALRRSRHVWFAVPFVVSFVFMLGPHLKLDGKLTTIPLPGVLVRHLPVFSSILPVRLCLYVSLFAGLLLGAWLDERLHHSPAPGTTGREPVLDPERADRTRRRLPRGLPAGALIAVALLPIVPAGPLHAKPVRVPHFFTSAESLSLLRPRSVVLLTPYPSPSQAQAMWWQAEAGLRFKMPGGYFLAPNAMGEAQFGRAEGPTGWIITAISHGFRPPTGDSEPLLRARQELAAHPFDAIIVGPMPHQLLAARFVRDLTGLRAEPVGGVWLFRFPPAAGAGNR